MRGIRSIASLSAVRRRDMTVMEGWAEPVRHVAEDGWTHTLAGIRAGTSIVSMASPEGRVARLVIYSIGEKNERLSETMRGEFPFSGFDAILETPVMPRDDRRETRLLTEAAMADLMEVDPDQSYFEVRIEWKVEGPRVLCSRSRSGLSKTIATSSMIDALAAIGPESRLSPHEPAPIVLALLGRSQIDVEHDECLILESDIVLSAEPADPIERIRMMARFDGARRTMGLGPMTLVRRPDAEEEPR